ncbi:alpha/beta fold hydrolase [Subtercola lobariae]|uniref:Alpha/beta hydrolase n=1 Tax=Subtercola lobariae TaxID=1588641 RepID=A0A917BF53_9MICO|nr:alpha/beta hydrolase [Subtercola lobariae]GGF36971.1 alpha/beta hydrolase [Subtercola lobariae]
MSEAFNPIDNTRIAFTEAGAPGGIPLVLVHGSGLSRAIWRGLGYVSALRDEYRLLLVDLRGHGLSGKPHSQEAYRMELVVADLLAVYEAARVEQAHYFGYSFGARAGFSLAEQHPERLLSFISAGGSYRSPAGSVGKLFFENYDEALGVGGMRAFLDGWAAASGHEIDPATTAAFMANDATAIRAYFRQVEAELGITAERLAGVSTPTLLLAGTDDRQRYLDSERAAVLMPHATFLGLPGRDHGTTLRPAAGVIEPVREFLAAVDAGRSAR